MADQVAVLAGGCFWCTEAVFLDVVGVKSVESGYTGGQTVNPTYKQVCGGDTGHAEAIRITFDADVLSYGDLLDIFFAIHDPTQLNRQGDDIGTQYRSAIFPQDEAQREEAVAAIARANEQNDGKVVTTIEPKAEWYPAEDYHQDYWAGEGQSNAYCIAVIPPKLAKLRKSFQARVKSEAATSTSPPMLNMQGGLAGNRGLSSLGAAARLSRSRMAAAMPSPGIGAMAMRLLGVRVGLVKQVEQARRRFDRVAGFAQRDVARTGPKPIRYSSVLPRSRRGAAACAAHNGWRAGPGASIAQARFASAASTSIGPRRSSRKRPSVAATMVDSMPRWVAPPSIISGIRPFE